jgi:hypothetical protein
MLHIAVVLSYFMRLGGRQPDLHRLPLVSRSSAGGRSERGNQGAPRIAALFLSSLRFLLLFVDQDASVSTSSPRAVQHNQRASKASLQEGLNYAMNSPAPGHDCRSLVDGRTPRIFLGSG